MSSSRLAPFIKPVSGRLRPPSAVLIKRLIPIGVVCCLPFLSAGAVELAPGWTLKTELTLEAETRRNFDLDDAKGDGLTFIEPRINLELEAEPADQIKAVIEVEGGLHEVVEDEDEDEQKLDLDQAYIQFEPDNTDTSVTVGRQGIDDEMQWLIDEELDGGRVIYEGDPIGIDVYVGRKSLVNLATPDEEEELITNYAGFLRYKFGEKSYVDGFVFYRDGERFLDDNEIAEEDLLFLGVQSIGKFSSELSYWVNAAYLTGDRRKGDVREDISAFGGDLGATYVFDTKLEPSITLGFAYGSGDSDPDDDTDHTFRQTGLHDNDYRLNGVTRFHYLGELVNPEIGNLMIFTAGLGIKPSDESSLDLVYHYYRQVEVSDDLVDTNLEKDPDGEHKDLGHALDLVFGYHQIENVELDAVVGVFFPGSAFADGSGNAYFGNVEVKYRF